MHISYLMGLSQNINFMSYGLIVKPLNDSTLFYKNDVIRKRHLVKPFLLLLPKASFG